MRQNSVGEPAATAALNCDTPRRRSSLKRLRPFPHLSQTRFMTTTEQSAPDRRISTFGLAVSAACAFSLGIVGQGLRRRQDKSHKPRHEADGRAQWGKSARCVRRGGGWKRGLIGMTRPGPGRQSSTLPVRDSG